MKHSHSNRRANAWHIFGWLGLLLILCVSALAERLPLKTYTTADGLANNVINRIVRDSRGFLWFCTEEGLSRFDGYSFTNYGTAEGLPHPSVNDFLETRTGEYWLATNDGLVRFNPRGVPRSNVVFSNVADLRTQAEMFAVVRPEKDERFTRFVTSVREDHEGKIWCGTLNGLFRLDTKKNQLTLEAIDLPMPTGFAEQRYVNDITEDQYGTIWAATPFGLYRRWPDGTTARYTKKNGLPDEFLHTLMIDHNGRLWVGSRYGGLFRLEANATHAGPVVVFAVAPHDLNQSEWINQILETSDHKFWAATPRGLLEFRENGGWKGKHYHLYTPQNGLSDHNITALAEDMGGSLWLGGGTGSGAMKLARNGFTTYDELDGIAAVYSIFPDQSGAVCFRGQVYGDNHAPIFEGGKFDPLNQDQVTYWTRFGRFDGSHVTWFVPNVLKKVNFGWVGEHTVLQARNGEWWVAMDQGVGLYHFSATDDFTQLQNARPLEVFGKESILGEREIWRLFEDARGRVWVATINSFGNGLFLWERETGKLRDISAAPNLPSLKEDLVRSFAEDHLGNVWIGFGNGLARFHDNSFTFFTTKEGLPQGAILDIYVDFLGRLWLASSRGGLIRIDDPARPTFTTYTMAQGLSSNSIKVITQDVLGRIYLGTGRGLDQLDPNTNRVKHFTTADGLASGEFLSAFRDRFGTLWFGMHHGLSRLIPSPDNVGSAPPIVITGLRIAGSQYTVSALGESEVALHDLGSNQNELQISFVGLSFVPGDVLRYQYKLGQRDWGPPTEQRLVNLAHLASGNYQFMVRAVNSDGEVSSKAAIVTFRILPPIWLRWWFLMLAALTVLLLIYLAYRYRVTRLLEVANMRSRIATDLHDDIGANLTRISILSEVAKQQFGNGHDESTNPLTSIAEIARESVASMSDIVWAINPERDSLRDLTRKMRQHADEIFTLRDIDLEFNAPPPDLEIKLGVNLRRDLLLIFKEAISNAARHSRCSRVMIHFSADTRTLSLQITDNGIGFDPTAESAGHGLISMQRRAAKLDGRCEIKAVENGGTTVTVRVPVVGTHSA